MELTKDEKTILTLLDECPTDGHVEYILKFVDIPRPLIERAVQRFLSEGLIEIVRIPQANEERDWYFATERVTSEMIDDDARYARDHGVEKTLVYRIEEETEEDRAIRIRARRNVFDARTAFRYERVELKIPREIRDSDITFAVMSISRGEGGEVFHLWLHAHGGPPADALEEPYRVNPASDCYIDAGGDIETRLTVPRDLLKAWTNLDGREIDHAFDSVAMGSTYNLMISIPRTITLTHCNVIVTRNLPTFIDPYNVCHLLLSNTHPIDTRDSLRPTTFRSA